MSFDQLAEQLESLTIWQGPKAGERLRLMEWQKRFLRELLEPGVQEAALSMARGNAKSATMGAIAAAYLVSGYAHDLVIVASSLSQGRITGEHCLNFRAAEITAAPKQWRVIDNSHTFLIENRATGSKVRVLGCDYRRLLGLAPTAIWIDEPSSIQPAQASRVYSSLRTAMGKQDCLLVAFGTRPSNPAHFFSTMLESTADVAHLYTAEPGCELTEANILKANPSMVEDDSIFPPQLREVVMREAEQAKNDTHLRAQFDAYRLNLGGEGAVRSLLMDTETLAAIEADRADLPPAQGMYCLGLDLSSGWAQTAAAACYPETGRCDFLTAFPRIPSLQERGTRDSVGDDYEHMARDGDLVCVGERTVDVAAFLRILIERWGPPGMIIADNYRRNELLDVMNEIGLSLDLLQPRKQNWEEQGLDTSDFRKAAVDRHIRVPKSFALRSAVAATVMICSPAGDWRIAKKRDIRFEKHIGRDDLSVALVAAVAAAARIRRAGPPRFEYVSGAV